jgi:hypothetical protein
MARARGSDALSGAGLSFVNNCYWKRVPYEQNHIGLREEVSGLDIYSISEAYCQGLCSYPESLA